MIRLTLNGVQQTLDVPPMTRLLDALRLQARLTGTKEGCGEGECGACTVLVDGQAVLSCIMPVCQAEGRDVLTIEGLAPDDAHLHPLQQFFVSAGGAQCGICTPGMILAAKALLDTNPSPSRHEVREALAGNLCRCTGYQKIVDAVMEAADAL
ncbi:MAG TPA: (2Fe-2S)-binding protein [Myxococcales bacterium]|nr:(2Fe-2S)-binding protein [Myxococcales bacterium]